MEIKSSLINRSGQRLKLIDPADYKEYFDWGEVGERIMERALLYTKTL